MGADGASSGDGKAKQVFWTVAAVLLVVLVGYNLYSGRTIEEIGLGGIGSVKFGKSGEPPEPAPSLTRDISSQSSPLSDGTTTSLVQEGAARNVDYDEMVRRQAELEAKPRQMEEALKRSAARRASRCEEEGLRGEEAVAMRRVNLAGTWHGPGVSWVIQQTGSRITIEEINPILGVTAVGQGTAQGSSVRLTYTSALQTTGEATSTVSPDGLNLTGTGHDLVTGVSFPLTFSR